MLTFFPSFTVGAIRRKLSGPEAECMRVTVGIGGGIIEHDAAALGADASRGGFQQPADAPTELARAEGSRVFADALREVRDNLLERLAGLDTGAEDVAAAIIHHQPTPRFQALGRFTDLDPAVIDLDGFAGVELVEDQALAGAGEDHLADLDG